MAGKKKHEATCSFFLLITIDYPSQNTATKEKKKWKGCRWKHEADHCWLRLFVLYYRNLHIRSIIPEIFLPQIEEKWKKTRIHPAQRSEMGSARETPCIREWIKSICSTGDKNQLFLPKLLLSHDANVLAHVTFFEVFFLTWILSPGLYAFRWCLVHRHGQVTAGLIRLNRVPHGVQASFNSICW